MGVCCQIAAGAKPLQKVEDYGGVASARLENDHLGLGQPGANLVTSGRDR